MAIQIVATGSKTLTDLNDAQVLQALLNATGNKVQIYDPNTTTYSPSWVSSPMTITPELSIAGDPTNIIGSAQSITWYKDGVAINPVSPPANFSVGAGTGKPLTINANVMAGVDSMRIHAEIVWKDTRVNLNITTVAEIIFTKVTNGQKGNTGASGINALTAILSNEAHTFPATSAGAVSSYANSGTEIRVFEGTTELLYDGVGTSNSSWKVTAAGTNITPTSPTDSGTYATYPAYSAGVANGTDTSQIKFTIVGKRANGTDFTLEKYQTFSKSKAGVDGTTPTTYWMAVSAGAVSKSKTNALTPTSVTATGYKQTGTGSPVSDASYKFVVGVDTGSGFVDDAATAAAASVSKTVTTSMKALRFRMYQSSVTPNATNFIDETIVPVLVDGTDGINSVVASVWAPNGVAIRNAASNLTVQCDVYDGTSLLASGVTYLWYKLIGGSWTALTAAYTGYNTKTLTVTPAQIDGQGSFKCIATYSSKTYQDAITLSDFSDPITIEVVIPEGEVFKNSEGNKTCTCKVFQGILGEIDVAGTAYEYRWFLTKADGSPYTDASFVDSGKTYKTGKTIPVTAAQVTGTANLQCELWTKS